MSLRTRDTARHFPDSVADAAAFWDARLRAPDCTDEDRSRFAAWRDGASEHREAFERLQAVVEAVRAQRGRAEVRSLHDAALRAGRLSSRHRVVAAVSATILVTGIALILVPPRHAPAAAARPSRSDVAAPKIDGMYQTGTGETSAVTLEDGSTVTLNARTKMQVSIGRTLRQVELIDGQALFRVAKDPSRPFVVRAAGRDITAIGTAFDVRVDATSVRVTLLEGKLRVSHEGERPEPGGGDLLAPGQQLVAQLPEAAPPVVRQVDVVKVTDWRNGRIFLEDLALASAVEEMNRYSPIQINIADPQIAALRVNGMFRAGEQEAFVTALEDYFPVSARRESDRSIALVRSSRD